MFDENVIDGLSQPDGANAIIGAGCVQWGVCQQCGVDGVSSARSSVDDGTHIQVQLSHAREVEASAVRHADALLLATPENFMSGELKAMFDRTA